ncbi:MAG: hypothetical protein JSV17_18575 [Candidatus Aminicenantes bacterium]|nr:MAG: hypothetical protein JSV17_18575 [Candidatus Aminicenantes bacterium]
MRRKRKSIPRIFTIWLIASALALTTSYGSSQTHEAETHQYHRHHIGLFLGGTSNLKKEETDFTLGIEYEYRLSKEMSRWSIGLIGELIFAHETEYLVVVPIILRVTDAFFLRAGPGIEWAHHGEENGHDNIHAAEAENGNGRESEFFVRVGIGYGFEVGKFSITPTLDVDIFKSQTTLVWGIAIGKGF